jgi:hypothetical protein
MGDGMREGEGVSFGEGALCSSQDAIKIIIVLIVYQRYLWMVDAGSNSVIFRRCGYLAFTMKYSLSF